MIEYDGYVWELVDDPICDVGDWDYCYEDCTECPEFENCFERANKIKEGE